MVRIGSNYLWNPIGKHATCTPKFDWPSIWGWNVVLNFKFVPISLCKLCQNPKVNHESLSETIVDGTPCSCTMLCTYSLANLSIGSFSFTRMKCMPFLKWSTTTQMESSLVGALGRPRMKSITISSHFYLRISGSLSIHVSLWYSALTC
jgi:hypothetical protein